ncbi:MAG: DUF3078 domain-containing protein [Bacteroidales bacterium]|nr:DUF3078 domain-containing protein [Bacteroidales bacterium]
MKKLFISLLLFVPMMLMAQTDNEQVTEPVVDTAEAKVALDALKIRVDNAMKIAEESKSEADKLQAEYDKAAAEYKAMTMPEETPQIIKDILKHWTRKSNLVLTMEQSSINNWAAGGYSNFAFGALFKGFYNYSNGKHKLDNTLEGSYGRTRQDLSGNGIWDEANSWIKSDDKLELNSIYGYQAIKSWNYSVLVNAKSQFDKGFDKDSNIVSAALSPLIITSSVGLEYKKSGFSALFSFLTGKSTYVNMPTLRGTNGYTDTPDDAFKFALGSYIKLFYQKDIFKNINLMAKLDVFYDYDKPLLDTDVSTEIFLNMKISKYFNAFINVQAAIDKDFSTHIQFKERFGVSIPLSF